MNSSEHYEEAERLLTEAEFRMNQSYGGEQHTNNLLAAANVHIQMAMAQGLGAIMKKYLGAK